MGNCRPLIFFQLSFRNTSRMSSRIDTDQARRLDPVWKGLSADDKRRN